MVTLTVPRGHDTGKNLKRWLDRLSRKWDRVEYLWVREFTKAGTPHYHVFLADIGPGKSILDEPQTVVQRRGKDVVLASGETNTFLTDAWIDLLIKDLPPDLHPAIRRFNAGGIVELLRYPDAAARYVAKEASKRCQKHYEPGRRWWSVSQGVRPKPAFTAILDHYPFEDGLSKIWCAKDLAPCIKRIVTKGKDVAHVDDVDLVAAVRKTRGVSPKLRETARLTQRAKRPVRNNSPEFR